MTIRELAKAAGVSTATVSRMLNKNGFVSKEAEEKINAAMKANNFNSEKRTTRRASNDENSNQLNFTMLWTSDIRDSMTATGHEMMLGITDTLRSTGANLVVDYIDPNGDIPKCLTETGCDGVFLHGGKLPKHLAELVKKTPTVWLLQAGDTEYGDRVQPDHWKIGLNAYEHLKSQNCKHVCCISHKLSSISPPYWQSRLEGFSHAASFGAIKYSIIKTEDLGASTSPENISKAAIEVVNSFEELSPRPDGLFITNALGPYINAELTRRGTIPMKDIYMISGDMDSYGQFIDTETIKIDIQAREIGKLAAEAMLLRLKSPDMDKIKYITETKLLSSNE
ncbi:LacI family DNA-binding transcriptional regulator [Lentisphaera marina]|uniref:LacI family DNA-binding transcriptional regulator n=1 Tax=Lentisphaera marina TaxID=1111041 RepID=UPI00236613E4|nr:LacI family DNA-binding transcriptional regulator [Lentisphaera marina]MDD7985314.1 LacI family DNA-binding transcriptional regulator [Lentisphaera marina]